MIAWSIHLVVPSDTQAAASDTALIMRRANYATHSFGQLRATTYASAHASLGVLSSQNPDERCNGPS